MQKYRTHIHTHTQGHTHTRTGSHSRPPNTNRVCERANGKQVSLLFSASSSANLQIPHAAVCVCVCVYKTIYTIYTYISVHIPRPIVTCRSIKMEQLLCGAARLTWAATATATGSGSVLALSLSLFPCPART